MKQALVFVLLLCSQHLFARLEGKARIDSLLQVLPSLHDDSSKVRVLCHLAYTYRTIDPEEGIQYANEALSLAKELNWKVGIALANRNLGLDYHYKSDYPRALEYFFASMKIDEEIGNKLGMGANYSHIAVIYEAQGNYEKALEYNLRSLKINEELKDTSNIAGDLGNIGILYMTLHQYDKALDCYSRSMAIFEQQHDQDGIAHNLGNIGNVYKEQSDFARALQYDFRAMHIFEAQGDDGGAALNMGNIGEVYLAISKDSIAPRPDSLVMASRKANLEKAIYWLEKSIAISHKISQLDNIIEFSKELSVAYSDQGNYKAALESYQQFATYRDSVFSNSSKVEIAKLETDRELYMKDRQILLDKLEVQKKRNERTLFIIGIVVLAIVIVIVLRKFLVQKRTNKLLAMEKQKHLAQIEAQTKLLTSIAYTQSHDVRGQVATILGLVDVFNFDNLADPDNQHVIRGIAEVTKKLDEIVKDTIRKENELGDGK